VPPGGGGAPPRHGAGDINIPASRAGLHPLSPAPI
jgi:hypothetical protein